MKTRALVMTLFLAACRHGDSGASVAAADPPDAAVPAGDAASAAPPPPDCGQTDAVSSEAMTGEAVFDLTSRCVFDRDVHEIKIRILGETYQKVLDDGCADKDSGFGHVIELTLDGKAIENVGIKVRGNTSKCNPKRQFKFKFDAKELFSVWHGKTEVKTFAGNDGRTFFGLEGFSVRAGGNDPSMVRERLSSRLFTHAERLAPTAARGGLVYRASFTKFFVSYGRTKAEGPEGAFTRLSGDYFYDYKGFYTLSENVDKTFLRSRFQVGDEKLKGFYLYQADKGAAQLDRAKYKPVGWSQVYIDGKKADVANAPEGEKKLFSLMDLLASNPDDAALAQAIDIDNIVNYVAAAELAGHWDSMLANRNNDFLFFNGKTGKWQILTWDLDNTQGALIDSYHGLMSSNIFAPAKAQKLTLFEALFAPQRTAFRDKLRGRLKAFTDGFSSDKSFGETVGWLEETVKGGAEAWEGYNHQSFEDIKNFGKARRKAVASQL